MFSREAVKCELSWAMKSSDPSLMSITGQISDKDVAEALYLVKENQAKLLAKWREIHG
jgi:hypothetical protein